MAAISPERKARLAKEREKNASGGSTNWLDTKGMTKVVLRLLPVGDDEDVGTVRVRYFINGKSYICNEGTHGKPGVIAKVVRALQKLDSAEAQEIVETLDSNRKKQYLMKVLDRSDDQVKWFPAPKSVYDPIFKAIDEDDIPVDDKENGRDFRVSKTGSGLNTEYSVGIRDASPIHTDKARRKEILAQGKEMKASDLIKPNEQEALDALMDVIPPKLWKQIEETVLKNTDLKADTGGDDDEDADAGDDEDDEDDKPKAKSKDKPKAKAKDDDDEDDEDDKPKAKSKAKDDDDEDDEDDEDEPKAKTKTTSKSKAKDEDDEDDEDEDDADDDEDDEDDEDEDEPKAKAKSKSKAKDDDDDEDDEDDEDEDDKPKAKAKSKAKDDDEDDDDEDEPKAKSKTSSTKRKYEVNDDEDEDDEAPKAKAKKSK